jgi:RND family efflux transporter MFP subunit
MLAGCHSVESVSPATVDTMQAHVVESRQQEEPTTARATGTLHARESATISAQVVGRIEQVLVHEGDSVKAGQALVVLDDATLRAAADQAQAAVKAAEGQQAAAQSSAALAASTLSRYKQLQAEKSVSPQEMDEVAQRAEAAASQVSALGDAARAQESGARSMLGYTRLRAPFAGVVTARMADPGTMAAPGVALLQIDRAGPLQLQAAVDESEIGSVRVGMKISLMINGAPNGEVNGTVAEIVPAADPASHSFMVKIDLPSSASLHTGVYGTAEFAAGKRQAILAPSSAIVVRGSLSCVYVLDGNGIAQLRSIILGAVHGEFVEVLSGLSSSEKLVDLPGDRDLAGKRIEAQP